MCELLFALLILAALVAVPLLLLGLMLKLAFGLVILAFKLIGALFHVGLAGLGLGLKVLIGLVGVVVGVVLLVFLVPLAPLVLVIGLAWIVIRLFTLCFA